MNTNTNLQPVVLALRRIAEGLTHAHRECIEIDSVATARGGVCLVLRVHAAEHPKIIGKQGRHITCITTIFRAIGEQYGIPLRAHLDEPRIGSRADFKRVEPGGWDADEFDKTLALTLEQINPDASIDAIPFTGSTNYQITGAEFSAEIRDAVEAVFTAIARARGHVATFDFL